MKMFPDSLLMLLCSIRTKKLTGLRLGRKVIGVRVKLSRDPDQNLILL